MNLSVPAFGTIARSLYPMYISDKDGKAYIPCDIMEMHVTESNEIPKSPTDDNKFVNDTIYKNPTKIDLKVYVHENEFEDFETNIDYLQSHQGFIIKGISKLYKNLRITSKNYSESSEVVGAYIFNLTFEEIILVKSKIKSFENGETAKKSDQNTKNTGSANTLESTAYTGGKGLGVI